MMKKLDLSRLNVFLDFIQNTHQYTELGWVHEATDAMYKNCLLYTSDAADE